MDTYSALLVAVGRWLDRDDLDAQVPDFIRLTEAQLNRRLSDPEMEVSTTLTGDGALLPDDFGEMVSIGTADGYRLTPMSNTEYSAIMPSSGKSAFYTIREGRVYYNAGAVNPVLVYRRSIPPLTATNSSNWLLLRAPDVYLYGALLQASAFLVEDERIPLWKSAFEEAVVQLQADGARRKWGAGTIAPRIARP